MDELRAESPIHMMNTMARNFLKQFPDQIAENMVMVIPTHVRDNAIEMSGVCPVFTHGIEVRSIDDCPPDEIYIMPKAELEVPFHPPLEDYGSEDPSP
jgi:hypothetical protein